jgi:hypothetical protein
MYLLYHKKEESQAEDAENVAQIAGFIFVTF